MIVASGHRKVSEAALQILEAGGNAFDGIVAAGFASSVAEPALTSLGGGGFLLGRLASGKTHFLDFFTDTPGRGLPSTELTPHFLPITVPFPNADQVFHVGRASVAVPGNLKGFLHTHECLGRIPLREVLQPAIALARDGVALNHHQAYFLELLRPIATHCEEGRSIYAPAGELLREGETLRNHRLASFLETLPSDRGAELYSGTLAQAIDRDMRDGQGLLTAEDLACYRVIERQPLEVAYRGHRLLTNPAPSFGGGLLGLSLQLLEAAQWGDRRAGSPSHLLALLAVMEEVHRLRESGCLDPGNLAAAEERTITKRVRRFSRGTTHVSVCDGEGNVASMTTSNGEGSGYLVPGTGIMLNNMLGEDDLHPDGFHSSSPGERVSSMMSPSLLLEGDRVRLVLGSGGSKRIRTALLQVISLVVDFDLDIVQAVETPRIHWDGALLQVEPGLEEAALQALRARHPINEWDCLDVYFGGVNALEPSHLGAGDPRRGGCALVGPLGR